MNKRSTEILVGLFVVLGALGLLFLALKAANLGSFTNGGETYVVQARFDNIGGLKARAPVRAAGVVIGPVLHLIGGSGEILAVAELGVVLLLFIIGLELKPSRLWHMRRDIFGLGTSQVVLTGLLLTALVYAAGLLDWRGALVAGFGLALDGGQSGRGVAGEQGGGERGDFVGR